MASVKIVSKKGKVMNKQGHPAGPQYLAWFQRPSPQYIPMADVEFYGDGPVMPQALPPKSMQFPNTIFNKILNIQSTEAIYDTGRKTRLG